MSLKRFKIPVLPENQANATSNQSVASLPTTILEAFIPGYSLISRFLLEAFGFDASLFVSIIALAFALFTAARFLYGHALSLFEKYFMSSISIEAGDDIYDHIMAWLAEQRMSKVSRSLVAKTGIESAWDPEEDFPDPEDQEGLFNFSNWEAKVPPRFEPYFGSHGFFHRGRYLRFAREKDLVMGSGGWGNQVFSENERITLSVIGRSTQPIKDLIVEARDRFLEKERSQTVIRRPATKEMRGRGRNMWSKVATRPSRPMETVVLDPEQKAAVLADINEYLHPASARWYARRGIPYRRGVLLYGPPGTGKTSLSFAIAGVFGLEIYCISLLEPTLTEEDLAMLFNSLPRRCVVLLEDIDSAGLNRKEDDGDDAEGGRRRGRGNTATDGGNLSKELARAFKSVNDRNDRENVNKNKGISLSGLLNAIDGVASHEGRVLIMTTNHPEKLDDALIRPGRVDMQIEFTLAKQNQIQELFLRMYTSDTARPAKILANGHIAPEDDITKEGKKGSTKDVTVNGSVSHAPTTPSTPLKSLSMKSGHPPKEPALRPTNSMRHALAVSHDEILDLAEKFATRLPESTFSPAEIQGFLLTKKKDPYKAVEEVGDWKLKTLQAREARKAAIANDDGGLEAEGELVNGDIGGHGDVVENTTESKD